VNDNFDAIYDDVLAKLGVWTSYTPTITQASGISKTVTYSRYIKLGRLVIFECYLAITGAGSTVTPVTISLPVTAAVSGIPVGTFYWYDASAPTNRVGHAVLSGPSFAQEVAAGLPVALTVASRVDFLRRAVQQAFHHGAARIYGSDDMTGVELGGALKNVMAIAAGICDGLRLGHNARAALNASQRSGHRCSHGAAVRVGA
jgi:hypothetical protein